jgi:hypothetical protein
MKEKKNSEMDNVQKVNKCINIPLLQSKLILNLHRSDSVIRKGKWYTDFRTEYSNYLCIEDANCSIFIKQQLYND